MSKNETYTPELIEAPSLPERKMLWEHAPNDDMGRQLARIGALSALGQREYDLIRELQEQGVPEDTATVTLDISVLEGQAMSFGLNLVGFFAPYLAEPAKSLLMRLVDRTNEFVPSDELQKTIDQAYEAIAEKRLAEALGLTVEGLREEKERLAADIIEVALDKDEDGQPNLN